MPFLNQRKGENDCRKYFMIKSHERMMPTRWGTLVLLVLGTDDLTEITLPLQLNQEKHFIAINNHKLYYKSHWSRACYVQSNILSGYPVILPSQLILLSDATSEGTCHVQGNILSGFFPSNISH